MNSSLFHQRAQEQYQRMQAETASPGQLVLMLYQGCLRFIGRGRAGLQTKDYDTARVNFLKAQDIVAEFMGSLNMDAGELSEHLMRLYDYMHRRLIEANIRRDDEAAADVEKLVRTLLPAWEEAVRQSYTDQPAGLTSPAALSTAVAIPS